MRAVLLLLAGGLGGALALLGLLLVRESRGLTHPWGYAHPASARTTPAGLGDVEVPLGPGQGTLRGWLAPGAPGARVGVVASHGRGADRTDFLRHLPVFQARGVPVLLFDHREHGASPGAGRGQALGTREAEDVRHAVRFLRARVPGVQRVVVVGVSLGATSAVLAAAQDASIDAVVAESPIARFGDYVADDARARWGWAPPGWGPAVVAVSRLRLGLAPVVDAEDVAARLAPRPLLLVHGTADAAVPLAHSERLAARAGPSARLVRVEGAAHARAFDTAPELWAREVQALLERLGAPAPAAQR